MMLKRFTRDSNKGFTLIELLVATLVAGAILSVSLGLINTQRRQFLGSQARAEANQSIRTSMDLIGADIKLTGERLETNTELPVITLVDGNGTPGDPGEFDRLTLQRQLITEVLPVCQDINAGSAQATIDVAAVVPNPPDPLLPPITTCGFSNTDTTDAPDVSDSLEQFRSFRWSLDDPLNTNPPVRNRVNPLANPLNCAQLGGADGECSWAYIYDPVISEGEFFLYTFEDEANCDEIAGRTCQRLQVYPTNPANPGRWQRSYTYDQVGALAQQPRIYILEERVYSLAPDPDIPNAEILQLAINQQPPIPLVNQLSDFQVEANLGGVFLNSFNPTLIPQRWNDLERIRVTLQASNPATSDQIEIPENRRSLTSEFFPRNALSLE